MRLDAMYIQVQEFHCDMVGKERKHYLASLFDLVIDLSFCSRKDVVFDVRILFAQGPYCHPAPALRNFWLRPCERMLR